MKIGVVSDTHSRAIPRQLFDDFKDVDLIIHAGDFCTQEDLKKFTSLKEVKAVYGNMDESKLCAKLPEKSIFEWNGFSIGLFHGEGPPQKVINFVKERFKKDKVDVIVFGHSHQAFNEVIDGTLYFNPGSPNDTIFAPFCSYGILKVKDRRIVGEIIKVKV